MVACNFMLTIMMLCGFMELEKSKHMDEEKAKEKQEILPWKDVEACMDDVRTPLANHLSCPICGKKSEELHWIHFSSPDWTWEKMCGSAGLMSICKDCHCQVEFILESMN